ncbi:MAG: hypothetical protein ACREGF_00290 [Candidatus Saccharimonadales bacterium]
MDDQKPGQTISLNIDSADQTPAAHPEKQVSWDPEPAAAAPEALAPVAGSAAENFPVAPEPAPAAAPIANLAGQDPPAGPASSNPIAPASADQAAAPWQFNQENAAPSTDQTADPYQERIPPKPEPATSEAISWSASEFIAHQKSPVWYIGLGAAAIALAALTYLITRDKISTGVIPVVAVMFGAFAVRKPRVMNYKLDGRGLYIGEKFYGYGTFKSYSAVSEGVFASILLMPLKRFVPPLSLYFAPEDEAKILAVLQDRLPTEVHQADNIDRLMRRIRY